MDQGPLVIEVALGNAKQLDRLGRNNHQTLDIMLLHRQRVEKENSPHLCDSTQSDENDPGQMT